MSGDVEFVDGPPPDPAGPGNTGKGKWYRRCALMREHPGQWMRWEVTSYSAATGAASRLRSPNQNRTHGDAKPGEFEARHHTDENGKFWVYARYVGHVREAAS